MDSTKIFVFDCKLESSNPILSIFSSDSSMQGLILRTRCRYSIDASLGQPCTIPINTQVITMNFLYELKG